MFYFAWVDSTDLEFESGFARSDEDIFSFTLSQSEGDIALLNIVVKNPRIGLLNDTRKVWAWFSFNDGVTTHPLFFGRLVGIPRGLTSELVELQLVARPVDFTAQKEAVAESLRELPYYDPIFIDETRRGDPNTVLEGYSRHWHFDRVSHEVSTSDVIDGEDGTVSFTAAEILYDSVTFEIANIPIRRVKVSASFFWQQRAFGEVEIVTRKLFTSFNDLANAWPEVNADLRSGWFVSVSSIETNYKLEQFSLSLSTSKNPPDNDAVAAGLSNQFGKWRDVTSYQYNSNGMRPTPPGSIGISASVAWGNDRAYDERGRETSATASSSIRNCIAFKQYYICTLAVSFDPQRKQIEQVSFDVTADMQDVVTLPENDEVLQLTLNSQSLSETIPFDPETETHITNPGFPIEDTRRRSYIVTERGKRSLEYLMLVARAHIRANARAVRITFDTVNTAKWLQITLRKNATVADYRLPGGTATGKVTAYSLSLSGTSGRIERTVTIACAVGRSGEYEAALGDPTYVEAGYVAAGYQLYDGEQNIVGTDIKYTVPTFNPQDDGIDFLKGFKPSDFIAAHENLGEAQQTALNLIATDIRAAIRGGVIDPEAITPKDWIFIGRAGASLSQFELFAKEYLEANPTKLDWTLPALNGEFESAYQIEVDPILIPRMIDLEAASNA